MQQLNQLKETVLHSQDIDALYAADLELTELSSSLHVSIRQAATSTDQSESKGDLALATSLLAICRQRQPAVSNLAHTTNYNFRRLAQMMLRKETYNAIWEKAQEPLKQHKSNYELRQNRLE